MADISHNFGADLTASATGDLATAAGPILGQQRVLKRLLTNPGDYIWQPGYGAGLAQFIGQPTAIAAIQATIRSQIFKEAAVAQTPAPVINVSFDQSGTVSAQILYADAATGQTQILSFSAGTT